MWKPGRLTSFWASTACYRDSFNFLHYFDADVQLLQIGFSLAQLFNSENTALRKIRAF
jgi:hypothetical protein